MNVATHARESELNRRAYERLREVIKREHAGKYIALANGTLVGVADTFDAAKAQIESLANVPECYLVFPADAEPDFDVIYDLVGERLADASSMLERWRRRRYWINVKLGSQLFDVLIDTGLIDSRGQVGFSIDEALYDSIKLAGEFLSHQSHARLMANGQISLTESGSLDAQLVCPLSRQVVGPVVRVHVFRGVPGVQNRVGLAFFHLRKGCKVIWDLDNRTWCIEYS